LLEDSYDYDFTKRVIITVIASIGGVIGSSVIGYCGQIFGRRSSIVAMCLFTRALLYPYTFVSSLPGLCAAAFFMRFYVEGAFGVVPVHLIELSPPAFRTFIVGTSYHLGIFVASSSIRIQEDLEHPYPLPTSPEGIEIYDYRLVMCLFMVCVFAFVIIVTILGPERLEPEILTDSDDHAIEGFD
jgi:SHS family lactate transporter-like MFS transporter